MATAREVELAARITQTAEAGLIGLEAMMKQWPNDFRAIMWEAVVEIASRRAASARNPNES